MLFLTLNDSDDFQSKKQDDNPIENKERNEMKHFCWNCGTNVPQQGIIKCLNCRAPLDEDIKDKLMARLEPVLGVKCWECKGTTSGNTCGICGAPLTREGLALTKVAASIPKIEYEKTVQIIAPQIRDMKSLEITLEEFNEAVAKHVNIVDSQIVDGIGPKIIIQRPENEKAVLASLRNDPLIVENNLKVLIRNEQIAPGNKQIVLRFYYWEKEPVKERYHIKKIGWNIGLYIATFVTVALAGWNIIKNQYTTYEFQGNLGLEIFLFTISLMGILTIHELGHFFVSRMKKVDVTLPYFIPIPSIPGVFETLGTFGALIRQKEQISTRDDLFDIGFAGPIAGFLITIPIMIIGLRLTYVVDIPTDLPEVDLTQIPTILLFDGFVWFGAVTGIIPYFDPTTQTIVQHPVLIAGYIGLILTGLNLMPAGQLDGGHTTRAIFGDVPHRILTLVAALLLALNPSTRYFGILILVMSMFAGHPGSTDDVSKVHWSKYVYIALGFIIGIVCLPLPINLIATWFS